MNPKTEVVIVRGGKTTVVALAPDEALLADGTVFKVPPVDESKDVFAFTSALPPGDYTCSSNDDKIAILRSGKQIAVFNGKLPTNHPTSFTNGCTYGDVLRSVLTTKPSEIWLCSGVVCLKIGKKIFTLTGGYSADLLQEVIARDGNYEKHSGTWYRK